MAREYDDYVKPIMEEMGNKFKYLTKLKGNNWLIQSKKNSMMESFCVHTTDNCHIIMTGDYDGIMVRPYGSADCLPNWMAGATTLSYFAEKVMAANQYHTCKEYSQERARKNFQEIKESLLEDLDDNQKKAKGEEFDDFISWDSGEPEHGYWTLILQIESEFYLHDLCEYDPTEYTSRIVWQHKCLVFWANKVLDGEFKEKGVD